jgi:uncharacterized protein YecE (DUF72 family)
VTARGTSEDGGGRTRVGPSGWSYEDWKGIVYPSGRTAGFDALKWIARYFDCVEINTSFYRPVIAKTCESWRGRIADLRNFRFTAKLHQSFTHSRLDYPSHRAADFVAGFSPLIEAGLLGCLLAQFPWSFRRCRSSVDWLRRLADDFATVPLVAEFRHDSWMVPETFAELSSLQVGFCNIDQPLLGHCLAPSSEVTSPVGYVRFHGRREDTWFGENRQPFERYNYLYDADELESWVPRIRRVEAQADDVYVFANNHYRGQGPANAIQLRAMLDGGLVPVPDTLLRHFPQLQSVCDNPSPPFPESLFD